MTLGEYLKCLLAKPRDAGQHDCATFPANWAVACGHPDPMLPWRGQYSTEAEAEDLIAVSGGLVALFTQGLCDCVVVDSPEEGDIAIIEIAGAQAGAIFTGKRWAVVADRGLAFGSIDEPSILKIWRP